MKITFISDTHAKHHSFTKHLKGGDIIIHSGDIMTSGYNVQEIIDFLEWFNDLDYAHKIFIAGNHDRMFENSPQKIAELLVRYPDITYLEDSSTTVNGLNIYGSPWQPWFYDWAYNLPRNGSEIDNKWSMIPNNTDILITHSPPQSILDTSGPPSNQPNLGCERLYRHVSERIKPLIHVFGHIHGSYGERLVDGVQYINASNLDERYNAVNLPINIEINNKEVIFIKKES